MISVIHLQYVCAQQMFKMRALSIIYRPFPNLLRNHQPLIFIKKRSSDSNSSSKCMPTILDKNIGKTTNNGVILEASSNVKLFLQTTWLGLRKCHCIYIYKDIRLKTEDLRSNESRDHYHMDGYLVPSPRYVFRFEAVSRL